ncbi:hypothetical protein Tco_0658466 [Tanacetum coccineum]
MFRRRVVLLNGSISASAMSSYTLALKSRGMDLMFYLRPLIEDLQVLWDKKGVHCVICVETTDIVSGHS